MKSTSSSTLALFLLCLISACAPAPNGEATSSPGEGEISDMDMLAYLEAKIDIADGKFMQLAEAIPEESYDYRPMEGVRSFREVFIHVAADNWYGGALMGIDTPEDIGVTNESGSVSAYQEQVLSKAETLVHLRRSFDFFGEALDATRSDLGTTSQLRETEVTYGDLWVRLVTHMHEHLGQTIAYARANEIAPPWSR